MMHGYFDGNATTPLWPEAMAEWARLGEHHWANPSALYRSAADARYILEGYRQRLAQAIGVREEEIVFTGGATEGNNAVLRHWMHALGRGLVSAAEHPSVSWALEAQSGIQAESWPVTSEGQVSLEWLEQRLQQPVLPGWLALQAVNNETGVVQPLVRVLEWVRPYGIPVLCDASQYYGKLPVEIPQPELWLVGCAHKFGGPRGVGWIRIGAGGEALRVSLGGKQERGHRAGTENLQSIGAMVVALEKTLAWQQRQTELEAGRNRMEARLLAEIPGLRIAGYGAERVWNTSLLVFPRHANHRWVTRMNRRGFCLATGAACSSGEEEGSSGLLAMGYSHEERKRSVRVSAGWWTSAQDWQALTEALIQEWRSLEKESLGTSVVEVVE